MTDSTVTPWSRGIRLRNGLPLAAGSFGEHQALDEVLRPVDPHDMQAFKLRNSNDHRVPRTLHIRIQIQVPIGPTTHKPRPRSKARILFPCD